MEARYEKAKELSEETFKRLFGIKRETFEKAREILQNALKRLHKAGGSPPKLSVTDKLMVTLQYLREYRTMSILGMTGMLPRVPFVSQLSGLRNSGHQTGSSPIGVRSYCAV
jgi:hypothetical protein